MGKPSRAASKRPMKGFTKITFGEDGSSSAVSCPVCGKTACFCVRDMGKTQTATAESSGAVIPPSPALSSLSVRLDAGLSPTFTFQPYSGYGNTSPPPFSLEDGPSPGTPNEAAAARTASFFGGGSPSWILHGWTFSLSATGPNQDELATLIDRHGGTVSRLVHKRVDVLVATEEAVRVNSERVRKAHALGIPLVSPAFVHDALKAGAADLDLEAYAPEIEPPPASEQREQAVTAAAPRPEQAPRASRVFVWRKAIRRQLRLAPGATLRRKQLREAVLRDHLRHLEAECAANPRSSLARQVRTVEMNWWLENPLEQKKLFRRELQLARRAGRLETEGRQVRLPVVRLPVL